ncbi:methyltransferase [Candidatus Poribacteria bacterium]|nr:methyltransferase [Candidatus Poribacteria bacterium]
MKTAMTSRERVWKAIHFEEADRVPIDIGGTKVTGICIDAYVNLVNYLGFDSGLPKVYEQFGMLARVEEPVRRRLHSDVIELENPSEAWGLENKNWKPWKTGPGNDVLMPGDFNPITDEHGYIYIKDFNGTPLAYMPPKGLYFERACVTTMSEKMVKMAPEVWKRSIPLYTDKHLRQLEESARQLYENTEYSVHGGFLKGMMGSNGIFAGHTISDWLCILITDKDYAFSILQVTAERAVENLRLYLQAVGDYIDTIFISGTDFGTQKGELFSPEIFKELYVSNMKLMNDYVHKHSKAKTFYHSCGSNFNLIEYFIEAGVDILNPVQTTAANMDPVELKKRFRNRIVFWGGGVDTQTVLPRGTVEEVRNQVKERIRAFAPGGGFVFTQVHNIQYGFPPQNIIGMADAVLEFGEYPICFD